MGGRDLRGAEISACGRYRWRLERAGARPLAFVMLNPSRADAARDDPTVRRCLALARDLGHCGLVIGNLYALRAPDPKALRTDPDPIGPENDAALARLAAEFAARGDPIVCAWGNHGEPPRANAVIALLRAAGARLVCLGLTARGAPRHPLYAPHAVALVPYAGPVASPAPAPVPAGIPAPPLAARD